MSKHDLDSLENELAVASCKRILFDMYHTVEIGQINSRSPYGDKVLELRSALYRTDERKFYEEYRKHEIKMGWDKYA